jgi:hypothetical protein
MQDKDEKDAPIRELPVSLKDDSATIKQTTKN